MSTTDKTISVVVTCYNYASFIRQAVDSIFAQIGNDCEIVIVNDGSTDRTDEVIKPYLGNRRIRYIKQKNAGQANAKNNGIRNSTGRFIAFLDADDLWQRDKLEKQMKLFVDPDIGVVYSRMKFIDEFGKEVDRVITNRYLSPREGRVTDLLFFDNFVPFSSAIVRRECFEKVGLFDESLKMGIDWDLWLRISIYYQFAYVDEPLLLYRIGHSGQMSKNARVRQQCSDIIMSRFVDQYPHLLSKSIIRKAWAYTYCNRGDYYTKENLLRSFGYYLKAVAYEPFRERPYRGLVKNTLLLFQNRDKQAG